MAFTIDEIKAKFKALNLIDEENKPILFNRFKNKCSIHKYGKKSKIVFIGFPKENLIGFYVDAGLNDINATRQAYEWFCDLVGGEIGVHLNGYVQFGNCGIPLGYGNLRYQKFVASE